VPRAGGKAKAGAGRAGGKAKPGAGRAGGKAKPGAGRAIAKPSELQRSVSLLAATLDATADGLLIVDRKGRIVRFNKRFARMWDLSSDVMKTGDDNTALHEAVGKVREPEKFLERVRYLYDHPDERSFDTIELADGRMFERYSRPQILRDKVVGRVWSFRDVSDRLHAEQALRQSEARYRRLFEESRQAIYITTRNGNFVDANPAACEMFGFTIEELGAVNTQSMYVAREDRVEFVRLIEEQGAVEGHPVKLRSRNGREMDCLLTSTVVRDASGAIVGYQGIVEDVTSRVQAERALRESELKFRSLIENASDTITVLDQAGQITYESPSLLRVLGYSPEALIGHNVFEFVHADDRPPAIQEFQRLVTKHGHVARLEVRFLHGDGSWRFLDVVGRNLLGDPAIKGIIVNARDVTERKEAEARLLYDAFHDKLTQLPNRALLIDRLAQLLRRARRPDAPPFAVLFLDLDRFKVVNDSLGHMTGDQLLIATARRLEASLRPGDTVARLGGDEFTMLLDGTTVEEARVVAERVQQDFQAPLIHGDHEIYVTVSIGIAASALSYRNPEELLRDADVAMYRAKEGGRARFEVFDESMRADVMAQLELETDLRRAIERNEFEMVYQPIITLDEGTLYGFEALIRWNHPQRGFLVPAEFTKLAEDSGLIVPMGWWVIRDVCRLLREWSDDADAAALPVHVNVSAQQIVRTDFIPRMRAALEEFGTPPHLLHLELTEGTMMQNAEQTTLTLQELKQLGIGLSIDDFGTGYSSLAYLSRFPTDGVKIDRSFITKMGPQARDTNIVHTIVELAHDLGMRVIAEGIETEAQASALRGMRCECGQGFHFSRPVRAVEAGRMLRAGPAW
jgi:diguanylate cyclase (GGDEF)-like protein/PAS domain S-box-containing protein